MIPGHYFYKALEDRSSSIERARKISEPILNMAEVHGKFFLMPDGGDILHPVNSIEMFSKMVHEEPSLFRLPFPVCVLEFSTAGDGASVNGDAFAKGDFKQPRCCVAWELDAHRPLAGLRDMPPGSLAVWSTNYMPPHKNMPGWWCGDPVVNVVLPNLAVGGMLFIRQMRPPWADEAAATDPTFEAFCDASKAEVQCVTSLCMALACSNVTTSFLEADARLNIARIKRGRKPFAAYHVLQLVAAESGRVGGFGSHASPAMHVRRGHIRRLASGRRTWVNQCVVGRIASGLVDKDYDARSLAGSM